MKIMLAMPTRSGSVAIETHRAILNDAIALSDAGHTLVYLDEIGNTNLQKARLIIAEVFRKSDCDRLVMIDDDVFWQPGGLVRLLSHDVPFVGGAYPCRKDELTWPVGFLEPGKPLYARGGLIEMAHLPGGFWSFSRDFMDAMAFTFPHSYFDRMRIEGEVEYSEDISFCHRAKMIGIRVMLDPEISMGHVGRKAWNGCIGDWLRERNDMKVEDYG